VGGVDSVIGRSFVLDRSVIIYDEGWMPRKKQKPQLRFLLQTLLPEAVWRQARVEARAQDRTVSSWLRSLVMTALEKRRRA